MLGLNRVMDLCKGCRWRDEIYQRFGVNLNICSHADVEDSICKEGSYRDRDSECANPNKALEFIQVRLVALALYRKSKGSLLRCGVVTAVRPCIGNIGVL